MKVKDRFDTIIRLIDRTSIDFHYDSSLRYQQLLFYYNAIFRGLKLGQKLILLDSECDFGLVLSEDFTLLYFGQLFLTLRDGYGVSFSHSGVPIYAGEWSTDQYHGEGCLLLFDKKSGTKSVFSGSFKLGQHYG
jgi:hypothetical protein